MLNIVNLIDEAKCYEMVRTLRWSEGIRCAYCDYFWVKKRGFHNKSPHRQRYVCKACERQFDDLTNWSDPEKVDRKKRETKMSKRRKPNDKRIYPRIQKRSCPIG